MTHLQYSSELGMKLKRQMTEEGIENPVRRIRNSMGMTLDLFAAECGVHVQALYLCEQGVYHGVLPKIMSFLTREGHSADELREDYANYQRTKRSIAGALLHLDDLTLDDLGAPDLDKHPVEVLRNHLAFSKMQFAKILCIHPATMNKLEKGEAYHLSEQMRHALLGAGIHATVVHELNLRVGEYADDAARQRAEWRAQAFPHRATA